jgi:hypothetical protein
MPSSVSTTIQTEAAQLIEHFRAGNHLGSLLNDFLVRHLPQPYKVSTGRAVDSKQHVSPAFNSLIHTASDPVPQIPADNLACVIDIHENLGLEGLRASYEKIAAVKGLEKGPRAKTKSGMTPADAVMGIVLAVKSDAPLEKLAEELELLNRGRPYQLWTDVVIVLTRGTVTYACQFPDKPLGDWLPPARASTMLAPMYLHIFARPHPQFALNRMCSLLLPYLYFFAPEIAFPNRNELIEGAPSSGMTIAPYQLNLKGEMLPVPPELRFNQFFLFPLGFRAEDDNGNVLSRVQYLPWQDGGVVRVSGKLPIEAFLVFAGKEALSQPIIRLPDAQISGIIPLSKEQFIQMAQRTARQSNLIIKPDERPKWVVEKVGDEGSSSPFVARLFLGVLNLRNQAHLGKELHEQFDKSYEGVMTGIQNIRAESKQLIEMYSFHRQKVEKGEGVKVTGSTIQVEDPIYREFRKQVEGVVGTAGRVCKDRMQEVLRTLGVEIGFLFRQQDTFEKEVAKLESKSPELAEYLTQTRAKWSERLVLQRNAIEHQGWPLPRVQYVLEPSGKVRVVEPLIDGQPITDFIAFMVDRVCCFVEELSAYALQAKMPNGLSISEIPIAERKEEVKERFQLALVGGGMRIWVLSYHDSKFEET